MAEEATSTAKPSIRSEARGPHWVAWVADADGKPRDAIVLVGETRKEAERRAKRWAEQAGQT